MTQELWNIELIAMVVSPVKASFDFNFMSAIKWCNLEKSLDNCLLLFDTEDDHLPISELMPEFQLAG